MTVCGVYLGPALAQYHFGEQHPFGPPRHDAFANALHAKDLQNISILEPSQCNTQILEYFHSKAYIEKVKTLSKAGTGYLDHGDTPAVHGIFEAACNVVGTTVHAVDAIMAGNLSCAFVPIAGLHHARRDSASGFCVFNDIGVAIEMLKQKYQLRTIAYIDIDAHHGDGVFYEFESDGAVIFADIHQDGRTLYPGTGHAHEIGKGEGESLKLNIPLRAFANDQDFFHVWPKVESFIEQSKPEFIILQAGADSLAGDPITQLRFSEKAHGHAAKQLKSIAMQHCQGRLLALGGGGYNLSNIAKAWVSVVENILL